jgi:LmbE family N-acetylglucosaminyl deacetylase
VISTPRSVLAIVAHPDDLEPQAGGTILKLRNEGSAVQVVTAVVPHIDRHGADIPGAKATRHREAHEATAGLKVTSHHILDIDPYELAHTQKYVQMVDRIAAGFEPDLVISHSEVDTQQDHVVVAKIAHTVCRKNRIALWQMNHSFPGGLMPAQPQPNLYVDVTKFHAQKMEAVTRYGSQVERYPGWLEGIEARDRYYGWMLNQEGKEDTVFAEGFVVQKMVWG